VVIYQFSELTHKSLLSPTTILKSDNTQHLWYAELIFQAQQSVC